MSTDGRTWHYRHFYRHPDAEPPEAAPLWLVVGNCQAEALRLVLDSVADRPYRTLRIPPVHELTAADLPFLDHALGNTATLICQPTRADYRDLPLGTSQITARLPKSARVVRWPVIRYAGLYPFQVIVRHPADRSVTPPVVPYHDLRTIAAAAAGRTAEEPWDVEVDADQLRAVAQSSLDTLAHREHRDTDVGVSDVLISAGTDACHTINHPGNTVLGALGARVLASLDVRAEPSFEGEPLLSSVYAPLEARVLDALGVVGAARPQWRLGAETSGVPQTLGAREVHAAHIGWYAENPDYVGLAIARHADTMSMLGLPVAERAR